MDRELHRLEAVKRFKELELDPAVTKDLNDIVSLAAQICNTPAALFTLVDDNTQWFKSAKGISLSHTSKEISFCKYTIQQQDVFKIEDATKDDRFLNNPLVYGDANIRFYAGAPLTTKDGFNVGSLCVVDFEKRKLTDSQQNSLRVLSKQVINLLELNHSLKMLAQKNEQTILHQKAIEDSELKLKAVFDSSTDIHVLVNRDMEVMAFNRPAHIYIASIYNHDITTGDRILNFVDPKNKNHFAKYFDIAFKGRVIKHELLIRPGTEFECWREIKLVPIRNKENEIIGVALNSADISKRKQQEKQIQVQNEALTRIAIIQSHELRRPVASLLGMMHLIKIEELDFSYFDMMSLTINELDEKIRIIVADSEKTISSPLSVVA
jgi:PAS domain S-box-containing protein